MTTNSSMSVKARTSGFLAGFISEHVAPLFIGESTSPSPASPALARLEPLWARLEVLPSVGPGEVVRVGRDQQKSLTHSKFRNAI
jgi:hypothetical protein